MQTKFLNAAGVPVELLAELDALAASAGVSRKDAFLRIVAGVDVRNAVLAGAMIEGRLAGLETAKPFGFHLPTSVHQHLATNSAGIEMRRIVRNILASQRPRLRQLVTQRKERSDETDTRESGTTVAG